MKKLVFLILFFPSLLVAQVGVGTTNPNASLDVRSSDQVAPSNTDGLLIPKIDDFPLISPTAAQNGMLVYATGIGTPIKGFYYWDNIIPAWVPITSIERINDLADGKSDVDGSNDGSSIFLGLDAGTNDDSTNNRNIGIGYQVLQNETTAENNVAIGYRALRVNTGSRNTAIGHTSLLANTIGNNNTALGVQTLSNNTIGQSNVAIGYQGLRFNVFGNNNVAMGFNSGRSLDDENAIDNNNDRNVYIGADAGNSDLNASNNVYIGYNAGGGTYNPASNTGSSEDKSGNVFIGYEAGYNESSSDRLYIANSDALENEALIYGEFDQAILRINGELQITSPGGLDNGYAFPRTDGAANQILVTNGSGQLTFEDQAPDISTFPIIRATLTADQALADTGWQKVTFNNVALNPTLSTEFNTTTNGFVAATAGVYRVNASYHTTTAQNNTQYYGIGVYLDATLYQEFSVNHYNGGTSSQVARQISCIIEVAVGQTISIHVNNNQAGVILDSFAGKTHFTIERIR